MICGNVLFEVEKIEQLALINRLTTHHDLRPSLKGSDDGIMIRQYPRGLFQQHRSLATEEVEAARPCMSASPQKRTMSRQSRHVRLVKADRTRRLQTTARGQPPAALGLRQTRSNGSRQAWGATS